jgi:hypothetical protein
MKQPLRRSGGAQIMMEIAKGCWEMRLHMLTGTGSATINAIMAEIGRKSRSDSKISLSIRIFVHKHVLKIIQVAVVIFIMHPLIFNISSSAHNACCIRPRRRSSSSANLPKKVKRSKWALIDACMLPPECVRHLLLVW